MPEEWPDKEDENSVKRGLWLKWQQVIDLEGIAPCAQSIEVTASPRRVTILVLNIYHVKVGTMDSYSQINTWKFQICSFTKQGREGPRAL